MTARRAYLTAFWLAVALCIAWVALAQTVVEGRVTHIRDGDTIEVEGIPIASFGWAGVTLVAIVVTALVLIALSAFTLAIAYVRGKLPTPKQAIALLDVPKKTTRALTADQQALFLRLLRKRTPDGFGARIRIMSVQYITLAEKLESLFKEAGWKYVTTNKTPLESRQIIRPDGVWISAFNRTFLDRAASIFRDVGITDVHEELRTTDVPETNSKYYSIQRTVYITIGYVVE